MITSDKSGYVCLLAGSLHGEKAASQHFLNSVKRALERGGQSTRSVAVETGAARAYPAEVLATLRGASAVVLATPLYAYCLPGGLMRLLEAWAEFARAQPESEPQKLYAIINCGFPVPETMEEAVRVIRHFCARMGISYRFSIAIASGVVAVLTEPIDLRLRRAYRQILTDITLTSGDPPRDLYLKPIVPRIVMDTIREQLDARVQRDLERKRRNAARGR